VAPDRNSEDYRAREQRINTIVGENGWDIGKGMDAFLSHVRGNLVLPCEVTGTEDFNWEEGYFFGHGTTAEHTRLRKTQPSGLDTYELLELLPDAWSEWMLFGGEDIGARSRRKSDGREFLLGLSELEAADPDTPTAELLVDFSTWFVNSR